MRFHFDPNNANRLKEKQQKQPKIELQDSQNIAQTVSMDLSNENSNMGMQIQNQETNSKDLQKLSSEQNKNFYEPKESWEKLPDYPLVYQDLQIPDCNQNEIYLALYEQCFNEEINKFKEHYSQFKELIFYCEKMQTMMNTFLKKERQMKEKYCQPTQKDLPYLIKKLEYQQQIKEYEKSIEKFIKAQTKIKLILQNDIQQHVIKEQMSFQKRIKIQKNNYQREQHNILQSYQMTVRKSKKKIKKFKDKF
ncbi:unnamed protein product [Paramecium sonneborni]|uniref:Uncharacterized protein n=1 Tax=Paramecium sonneborni TaxID=65129 RepID=A0A8S1R496_9CILI|nr:unnamed protein product [Paramecium sonneborni]